MTKEAPPAWAERLRHERWDVRGWNKHEMARRLLAAKNTHWPSVESLARQIRSWEKGEHFPRDWSAAYSTAFGMTEAELFGEQENVDVLAFGRRDALTIMGAAGALEAIRLAMAQAVDRNADHAFEDWEEVAYEYGHAFLVTPPAALLPDLAADLAVLQEAIGDAQSDSLHRLLCGPGSKLMALAAMTVNILGDRRQARDWWVSARHAADASGLRDLRVWVRGYEAMSGLVADRPPALVLKRSEEAIAIAGDEHPCAAVLEALAARAQTLAATGRAAEAKEEITTLERRFEALAPSPAVDRLAVNSWPETALRHTQAYVHTHTGDVAAAGRAQDAALALYPRSMGRQRAQIELLRATCLVRQGEVHDGLQYARDALQPLGEDRATFTIRRGMTMVASAVPEAERSRPAVVDFRDALALPTAN